MILRYVHQRDRPQLNAVSSKLQRHLCIVDGPKVGMISQYTFCSGWGLVTHGRIFTTSFQVQALVGSQRINSPTSTSFENHASRETWFRFLNCFQLNKYEVSCKVSFDTTSCERLKSVLGETWFPSLRLSRYQVQTDLQIQLVDWHDGLHEHLPRLWFFFAVYRTLSFFTFHHASRQRKCALEYRVPTLSEFLHQILRDLISWAIHGVCAISEDKNRDCTWSGLCTEGNCAGMYSVHCRVIVDNKSEFYHSSSHVDCTVWCKTRDLNAEETWNNAILRTRLPQEYRWNIGRSHASRFNMSGNLNTIIQEAKWKTKIANWAKQSTDLQIARLNLGIYDGQ